HDKVTVTFRINWHTFLRSIWRDASRADVVVEIDGVEPRLDVFASLGVLPNVFGKKGQSFAITFRSPLFHVTGPGFDFPRGARRLGIAVDPFKDFAVAFPGRQLLRKGFE